MLEAARIDCPYCGEGFDTDVDCSPGSQQYVEDCPVCCQPIDITTDIDIQGRLVGVSARRGDD